MKVIVDNQILKLLISDPEKIQKNPFLWNVNNQVCFRWPTFLEYLDLGSLFLKLPAFEENQPLFEATLATLYANDEEEVLFHLYDRLFAENLYQINALDQIKPAFLLEAIQSKRQKTSALGANHKFISALSAFETLLTEHPSHTMHDLILYLAWDRMCVSMARLFDYPSTHAKFLTGIKVLKMCLIESYQHITEQGRTAPSFYRMVEALLFYQMREENLQEHIVAEWTLLSQSFPILKPQDSLADCFYIDDAVVSEKRVEVEEENVEYLTLDSPDRVNTRQALAGYMINKLKSEIPSWNFLLCLNKIVFFV